MVKGRRQNLKSFVLILFVEVSFVFTWEEVCRRMIPMLQKNIST